MSCESFWQWMKRKWKEAEVGRNLKVFFTHPGVEGTIGIFGMVFGTLFSSVIVYDLTGSPTLILASGIITSVFFLFMTAHACYRNEKRDC